MEAETAFLVNLGQNVRNKRKTQQEGECIWQHPALGVPVEAGAQRRRLRDPTRAILSVQPEMLQVARQQAFAAGQR
jgi:hypothetical protein